MKWETPTGEKFTLGVAVRLGGTDRAPARAQGVTVVVDLTDASNPKGLMLTGPLRGLTMAFFPTWVGAVLNNDWETREPGGRVRIGHWCELAIDGLERPVGRLVDVQDDGNPVVHLLDATDPTPISADQIVSRVSRNE